jgi:hypothetical protein
MLSTQSGLSLDEEEITPKRVMKRQRTATSLDWPSGDDDDSDEEKAPTPIIAPAPPDQDQDLSKIEEMVHTYEPKEDATCAVHVLAMSRDGTITKKMRFNCIPGVLKSACTHFRSALEHGDNEIKMPTSFTYIKRHPDRIVCGEGVIKMFFDRIHHIDTGYIKNSKWALTYMAFYTDCKFLFDAGISLTTDRIKSGKCSKTSGPLYLLWAELFQSPTLLEECLNYTAKHSLCPAYNSLSKRMLRNKESEVMKMLSDTTIRELLRRVVNIGYTRQCPA